MNKTIEKVIEELTKDCTPEDKAKILSIVAPGEPGELPKLPKEDLTTEEIKRIMPILQEILAAIGKEISIRKALLPDMKLEKFKKQLIEAHIFRKKHYKHGLESFKLVALSDIAKEQEAWEAITNSFDYGYMVGYRAAQRNARKKAAAQNEEEG